MSQNNTPIAVNRLGRDAPVADVYRSALRCYFRPETEEFVFLSDKDAGEFETHWRGMMVAMDDFHQAKANYSSALKYYDDCAKARASSLQMDKSLKAIDAAETELEKTREAIKEKLGSLSEEGLGYDDVVELIPIAGQNRGKGKRSGKSVPYAYVKKGYFEKTEKGLKLHKVKLKPADKLGGQENFLTRDRQGRLTIDSDKIAKRIENTDWSKIKIELQDVLDWAGSDFKLESLKEDRTLHDWAKEWNENLTIDKPLFENVDFSGGAQFMRFTSNVGASLELDVAKRQSSLNVELKRTLTLASGFLNLKWTLPDQFGWNLKMKTRSGEILNLGNLRVRVDGQIGGFVGGSLQLEGQVQVMLKGQQQVIAGQPGLLPRFRTRKAKGIEFFQAMEAEDEGVKLAGEHFRGARVEGTVMGALQWLKPTPAPESSDTRAQGLRKYAGEYEDFASIGYNIAGLTGLGVGGKFFCTFINGKFCFHVSASVCVGRGAKGGFIAEVNANNIIEFGSWLAYQIYTLDYGFFEVMNQDAYKAYGHICALEIILGKRKAYLAHDWGFKYSRDIFTALKKATDSLFDDAKNGISASKKRNAIAENVMNIGDELLRCTPETKGILLYLLTRHSKLDHADINNRTISGDIYHIRKEAVIRILTSIQTISEWHTVLCRMSDDGTKIPGKTSNISKAQEGHLLRFLREGHDRDDALIEHKWNIEVIFERLKAEPTAGYSLAMNDSYYYNIFQDSNPHYPKQCYFGECEPTTTQLV
ncbi:hypothetical protein ACIPL1_16195 [Pseudomonas sp. NPDC090202]|uniref:hypothetical protein n=1 Tax=unclassified Pseudomonas TaxID=196821 RepID=UPI00380D4EF8